tara:strand:- start:411 stop:644 length:234 start_codon:yes stop_codon:yes gene_type:complete
MITNPTLQILSSFEKLGNPETKVEPKGMGMMSRSRPPVQQMSNTKKQPAITAREIQMHIRNARKTQKNGGIDDGTIV